MFKENMVLTDNAKQWLEEYKEFVRDEYYSNDVTFDKEGYLGLAYSTIGANEQYDAEVSYNPQTEFLKTELRGEGLTLRYVEDLPIESASWWLDFDSCYSHACDLLEKFVGEDFEW